MARKKKLTPDEQWQKFIEPVLELGIIDVVYILDTKDRKNYRFILGDGSERFCRDMPEKYLKALGL